jgi:site-specific recombinase XerD
VLIFAGASKSGFLTQRVVGAALKHAMKAAGVSEAGPTGAKRTPHSTRHTHARIALQNGMSLDGWAV